MATCHPVIGATWPVNSPDAVTEATTGQRLSTATVNGGQPLSDLRPMAVVNDGQRWRITVDRRRTTTGPPVNGWVWIRSWVGLLIGSVRHVSATCAHVASTWMLMWTLTTKPQAESNSGPPE
ncbi:hypothetical protein Tco_1016022 [Tanacetum coccineum]|uniref:Uncharacterized protein n=1 Tax=Tanacetum coccineum TaxID=301880 RepID=A0ABQ5FPB8_9ASTR